MKHIAIIITLLILDGLILLRLLKTLTRWTFAKIGGQLTHITAGATEGNNYIRQPENLVYTDTRTGKEIAMKRLPALYAVAAILLLHGSAFALGGSGATCNPSTPNWGSCARADVPFAASVTNTVNVAGGTWSTPYAANTANTRYVLQGDVSANSSGFVVTANYVIIDLNGHTLTYNQTSPGEGVTLGEWNLHHIAIRNGSIVQGSAMSEGDQLGRGKSPVTTFNSASGTEGILYDVSNMYVANLYVRYGGRDVGGIVCAGNYGVYEQNTIEDTYQFGTLKNRHQGIDALSGSKNSAATGGIFRNNTLLNVRHRGINPGNNSEVYGNHITLRSIATNSTGISQFEGINVSIHDNTIIGRGEHPIGVGVGGDYVQDGWHKIYNNIMDMQTTALGEEYVAAYLSNPSAVYEGNSAAGIRMTWKANNVTAYNNQIIVVTDNNYTGTYSPTGEVAHIDGGGKGLFIGLEVPTTTAHFYNNNISVTGDGKYTYGVSCSYNFSDALFVLNNTVTTTGYNLVLGDDYGACNGYPLFSGNTWIKSGTNPNYKTFANTYNATDRHAQARIVDSVYQGGAAADSYTLQPSGGGITDIYFGAIVSSVYRYSYRLHDNNNTSNVLLTETFGPTITLAYSNPLDAVGGAALNSTGTIPLSGAGSMTLQQ